MQPADIRLSRAAAPYNCSMAEMSKLKPLSLRREGDGLLIEWDDGIGTFITWRDLREKCPCATCLDRQNKPVNPLHVLSEKELAAGNPTPTRMIPRGYYAYQIVWNDGHDTGIYSLDYLRQISKPKE